MLSEPNRAIVRELRESVEDQHRNALRAIETLEDYLTGGWVSSARANAAALTLGELIDYLQGRGSIRQRVLRAIECDYKSVKQVACETKLSQRQVRGVLYSRDVYGTKEDAHGARVPVGGKVEISNNGVAKFKLKPGVDLDSEKGQRNKRAAR